MPEQLRKLFEALKCNTAQTFPPVLNWMKPSPIFASLKLTQRCSGRCKTCNMWMTEPEEELTTSEWKDIITSLNAAKFLKVNFTGGDLLLRDDLPELIQFAQETGLIVNSVFLNGYTVTEKTARSLMRFNLPFVFFSLDTFSSQFNQNRGVSDAVDKVKQAVGTFKKFDNKITRFRIAVTIMKYNLESIPKILHYAIKNNLSLFFNLVHFTHYFSRTSFSKEQYHLDSDEYKRLVEIVHQLKISHHKFPKIIPHPRHLEFIPQYFKDYRQPNMPCYKTMLRICVKPNGDISPCCSMAPAGNIKEQDLQTIMRSESYSERIRKGLKKECPGCSCQYVTNSDFNLYQRIRNFF